MTTNPTLGLAIGPSEYRAGNSVVQVDDETTGAGNTVLRVGHTIAAGLGWERTEHVVLTPDEREQLIAALIAQRDDPGDNSDVLIDNGSASSQHYIDNGRRLSVFETLNNVDPADLRKVLEEVIDEVQRNDDNSDVHSFQDLCSDVARRLDFIATDGESSL